MTNMRTRVLKELKKSAGIVSGEHISRQLNISRVAVWKHIQKLLLAGYEITSGPTGYRLVSAPDTPFPWEFSERETRIHYFPELDSTMDVARQMARDGCPDFTVIIAETQRKGRGRLDRLWESDRGGLYFTLVLRPDISLPQAPLVSFAASLELAQTIREFCRVQAAVKWPNDILVHDKKLSGMLSEMETESDRISFINIGIGINVNNTPPAGTPAAVSLQSLAGKPLSRKALLEAYLNRLEARLRTLDLNRTIAAWKRISATLGREVTVTTRKNVTQGTAVDVDDSGALMVRTADGTLQKIYYGDCFHTPQA
jgi:BirA family biotin operon repressor/biotin-[acetyl-CoA-carboxylase] ligase